MRNILFLSFLILTMLLTINTIVYIEGVEHGRILAGEYSHLARNTDGIIEYQEVRTYGK